MANIDFNYIEINLDLMNQSQGLNAPELLASLDTQFAGVTDFYKPFLFKTSKTEYAKQMVNYYFSQSINESTSLYIDILNPRLSEILGGGRLKLQHRRNTDNTISVRFGTTLGIPGHEVYFLYENNDEAITGGDNSEAIFMGITGISWDTFYKTLKEGHFPAVYLYTAESGTFCPATYVFTPLEDNPSHFEGTINISYVKDNELWLQKMYFEDFSGIGSVYNYIGSEKIKNIEKISLQPECRQHIPLFLYNDSNGTIPTDNNSSVQGTTPDGWNKLYQELAAGKSPVVHLRTEGSGRFCPVSYHFSKVEESVDIAVKGFLEMSYMSEKDGTTQFHTERFYFDSFTGNGSSYTTTNKIVSWTM